MKSTMWLRGLFLIPLLTGLPSMTTHGKPRTYTNPIAPGVIMGDPFILHHEGNFYLYGTTDSNEGFRAWKSSDMVDWQPLGFVYREGPDTWGGKTFWAPEVVHHGGQFFLVFSSQPADSESFSARVCLAVAERPDGPFRDFAVPLIDRGFSCIDGHLFFDDDGSAWLYFARVGSTKWERNGESGQYVFGKIHVARMRDDLRGIVGEPEFVSEATQPWENPDSLRARTNEGPYVFRQNDVYYMTYSANHYADPYYGIGYATAPSPLGPWTKSPENPLVAEVRQERISGPGHNMVLTAPSGDEHWMVYHTHADPDRPSGRRVVHIDRLRIGENGSLRLEGPTLTPQPLSAWMMEGGS